MRNVLTTLAELAGMGVTGFGLGQWSIPLALVFAGGCLFGVGYLLGREPAIPEVSE